MINENLKNDLNKNVSINRVNVDVLKNRVFEKQRKKKFQSRIIFGSLIISLGLISYFAG